MKQIKYFLLFVLFGISFYDSSAQGPYSTEWIGGYGFDITTLQDESHNYYHNGNWTNGIPSAGYKAKIGPTDYVPYMEAGTATRLINYDLDIHDGAILFIQNYVQIGSGRTLKLLPGGNLSLIDKSILYVKGQLTADSASVITVAEYQSNELIVKDGGSFTNNGELYVYERLSIEPGGTLTNNHKMEVKANRYGHDNETEEDGVSNEGTINIGVNGEVSIIAGSGKLWNNGRINNNGLIKNEYAFYNENNGTLYNNENVENTYLFKNTGTINNSGTFTNDGGTFENHLNDVYNTGQFTLKNLGQYISTSSVAQFTNKSSGTFTGEQTSWFLNNYGQFTNEGTFNSKSNFENLATFVNTGTLTNHGAIELKKHLPPNVWSRMYNFGTLENKATIIIYDAELYNHEYVDNVGASIRIESLGSITNEECAVFNNGSTIDNYGTFTNAGFLAQWLGRGIGPVPVQHTASGSQLDRSMPNVSYSGVNKLHVKNAGLSSNHSGLTWSDAMGDLNFAMQMAKCHNIAEIWLSKGTYYPDDGSSGFYYQGGLKLYGGFNGNESSKENRDVMANKTILRNNGSGSIMTVFEVPGSSVIDGIHFIGGSASKGGAVHHSNSSNSSLITFKRCVFQNNSASSWGGAIYNEGLTSGKNTITKIENCIFYANTANWGGAININGVGEHSFYVASSKIILSHSTFLDNTRGSEGADIRSYNATLDANNNILWSHGSMSVASGNVEIEHSIVRGGFPGGTNILNQNPFLSDPESGDFSLRINSPAIDSGNGNVAYDIMGVSRPQGNGPDIGAYEYQGALPVEFLDFSANLKDQSVFIDWITGSEVNNDYFEVERSFDGKTWEIIGMVDGAGNSNQIHKYQYIDHHPDPGMNYYRLKQMDYNGQYEYSSIEKVNIDLNYEMRLYPNPTHDQLTLHIANEPDLESFIAVYNTVGVKLYETQIKNNEQPTLQLNLESINIHNPGQYHIVLRIGNHVENLSFIKI